MKMDRDWRASVTQRAQYASDRLRGLLSSGADFLRTELGVDLGLNPENCPSWAILSAALLGLTVLVWVAACGRRKRATAAPSPRTATETQIRSSPKTGKPEPSEPKKKNKKKAADRLKAQENGETAAEPKEETKVQERKRSPPAPAAPAPAQPPVDIKAKKNKKKPKPEVKATQDVSSSDGKEPDEGAWETKVSNREKRQQRKKEKGPGDSSGSPESSDRASWKVEQPAPVPATTTKKNKESSRPKAGKDDAVKAPVISKRIDGNTVNGGGWTEVPVKHQIQMNASNNEKRSVGKKNPVQKNRENSWKPESEGPLTGVDGRIKVELKPVNFTMLGLNTPGGEPGSQSNSERCSDAVDNEWSNFNGLSAVDPSSDWNAPTEIWGNYEEPKIESPVLKETPVSKPLGESNDDNDKADPAGSGKSKRRKKKKRPEEEGSATELIQESSAPAEKRVAVKPIPPHVPKEEVSKQNVPPPSSQKKSDQNWEPPKQVQKKKARRET